MAYGFSRSARGREPDPRAMIEEAAQAAGMSVQQWLSRARFDETDDSDSRANRRQGKGRRQFDHDSHDNRQPADAQARPERRSYRGYGHADNDKWDGDTGLSEERIARILDNAMGAMQDSLHSNEERTASALAALGRKLEERHHQAAPVQNDRRKDNHVFDLLSKIETNLSPAQRKHSASLQPMLQDANLVQQLEDKISNVVTMLEQKAAPGGTRRDLRQPNGGDRRDQAAQTEMMALLRGLDHKLTQLEQAPSVASSSINPLVHELAALRQSMTAYNPGNAHDALAEPVAHLRSEMNQLTRMVQSSRSSEDILSALRSMGSKIEQIEHNVPAGREFERLFSEVASLRAGLQSARMEPVKGLSSLEKHVESLGDRLDGIADKVSSLRFNGPRDLRAQKPIDGAFEELKHLIQASAAPADDGRVLRAVQSLERKLEALEQAPQDLAARIDRIQTQAMPADDGRVLSAVQSLERKLESIQHTPTELHSRLDRIQTLVSERPDASNALSPNTEMLLRNLAMRLESIQNAPEDDYDFDTLHADIKTLSRKLETSPAAHSVPAVADLSGLERSITDLFHQLDDMKSDIGATAEKAARRAASEVMSQAPMHAPFEDSSEVKRTLSTIHVAQQEADRRTNQTLGAVHETLQRVVDRLVDMERDMKRQAEISIQPVQPAITAAPSPVFQPTAPVVQPEITLPSVPMMAKPLPPLGAVEAPLPLPERLQPVEHHDVLEIPSKGSETVASIRAQRMGVSMPVAPQEATSKSALFAAFAAAKGAVTNLKAGKSKAAAETQMSEPGAVHAQAMPSVASLSDMPLEPGSGRPTTTHAASTSKLALEPLDAKTNFLVAARRAAQVAADQSADVLGSEIKPGKAGLRKKHALLLGLAALVVAVGASLQFVNVPLPFIAQKPEGKSSSLAPTINQLPLNIDRKIEIARNQEAVRRPNAAETTASIAPRQVLPPSVAANPIPPALSSAKSDDRLLSQPPRAARSDGAFLPPDPTTVGAITAEPAPANLPSLVAPKTVPAGKATVSSDPLLRFEGVKDADRLKEAARIGDPAAFIELANRHLEGKGAPRDAKTAALWLERAADAGSAPAQYRLGAMYREGRGVELNTKLALKYFQAAADAGNARAMHNTAVLLAEGVNGSPDYAGANQWFKKAAEYGIKDSQFNLAILYARGLGAPQDLMASYAWFAAAAATGDADAAKKRDEVGARLSAESLQQAKTAATTWKAQTPDPVANEVATPRGGWDNAAAKQVPLAAQPGSPASKAKPQRG